MICAFEKPADDVRHAPPFFGYHGPKNGERPELPLVYLPRGLDNSSGGQQVVNSDRWGPLRDQLLHFSFGAGSHFLILRDEVDGQLQGAVVPLRGEFLSGVHRGRFCPDDGQLYVTGMQGWGSAYGSPEFSTRHAGMRGHDHVAITSAHIVGDGRSLFLEMPGLQPVNQLHLRIQSAPEKSHGLFVTVHKLAKDDFTGAADLRLLRDKVITLHPILSDLAMATRSVANPHAPIKVGGRKITIETGSNLSFAIRSVHVEPGELIEFTLSNPDVVPHNWALVKPGTLKRVGDLANRLISDPEAAIGHYIPESTDVLAYTDVVLPKEQFTIYFNAPDQPGHYPFLCTFPGHWRVMNGEMIVGTNDN